jgi:hypothetical protein
MMLDGFMLSSRLIECSMPAYKSLMVTLQMSLASRVWLLKQLLLLVSSSERLSFLEATAMLVGQGLEGSHSLGEDTGFAGSPGFIVDIFPQCPGREHKVKVCHHSNHPRTQGMDHGFKQ